ncbi:MAG: MotA/TolQ/ExbB proton channel family protein [Pseudomonadota bacterium]
MHSLDIDVDVSRINSLLDAGGPVVVILGVMSIVGLAVLLVKIWQFFKLELDKRDFIELALNAWRKHDMVQMEEILKKSKSPIARVMESASKVCSQDDVNDELAREETLRVAALHLANARSYLRIIEVIAALSPLLGLFGTVLGMIEAFHRLEEAGTTVDPAVLSGGIWEALLTTAAGLAVAIPAILVLNWLEQRIDNFKLAMEDAMTQIFTSKIMN